MWTSVVTIVSPAKTARGAHGQHLANVIKHKGGTGSALILQINGAMCWQFRMPCSKLHPFNGLFSRTSWVSWYQKGRTILDFNEARDDRWQWHQLNHMQIVYTLLKKTDNHTSTSSCLAENIGLNDHITDFKNKRVSLEHQSGTSTVLQLMQSSRDYTFPWLLV